MQPLQSYKKHECNPPTRANCKTKDKSALSPIEYGTISYQINSIELEKPYTLAPQMPKRQLVRCLHLAQ